MKRGIVIALAAPTFGAAFVWAGCAAVLDLGDEARLRTEDAAIDSAPQLDAETVGDGGPELSCGLPRVVNPDCRKCTEEKLCEKTEACATEPGCPEALLCLQDCMAQFACIQECIKNSPALKTLTYDSPSICPECTPQGKCILLGTCASGLDPDGGALLRTLARQAILELDENHCDDVRLHTIGVSFDASDCTRPFE